MADDDPKAAYERLRAAHLTAVRASLEDHVARLDWPRKRIERYQTERLRSLLAYARERSSFHAARMANIEPATATIDDLTRLPPMLKQEAQSDWDAIITAPDITHARAEQVLAQQPWFSYTPWETRYSAPAAPAAYAVCTSGIAGSDLRAARLGVLEAGEPPHASTPLFDIAIESSMETTVIPAAAPFDQVQRAVADAKPTQLVGYASVIGRLARATTAGNLAIRPCSGQYELRTAERGGS